ncbi:hypothetical protein LTR53_005074 [Teratosphaeriaceae sp. CCFEE 6253]|nr:hypothetical protein LTR53_005074 [Teratosphaeriaceae sp. CCFEE 6253]
MECFLSGEVTRLYADKNHQKVRAWVRDQIRALAAECKVNATGARIAVVAGKDDSILPVATGLHLDTIAMGRRDDGPLDVGIGYVGDGPNTVPGVPISAHSGIHVALATTLEKAVKPIGGVQG